jgi:hypothetical protein
MEGGSPGKRVQIFEADWPVAVADTLGTLGLLRR